MIGKNDVFSENQKRDDRPYRNLSLSTMKVHCKNSVITWISLSYTAFHLPTVYTFVPPSLVHQKGCWSPDTTTELAISSLYAPPPSATDDNADDHQEASSQHFHDFWKKPQSQEAIRSHVQFCLDQIEPQSSKNHHVDVISNEPPLLVIHDFLPQQMCQQVMQAAMDSGKMERSTTGATQQESSSRTSSTVWLNDQDCTDPLRLLAEKVSLISGLPPSHMENLQVCRYQPGQRFNLHTDHQESFNDLECRGRLATCLIYLHEPTDGGQTWFPNVLQKEGQPDDRALEVNVPVTQGSAIFFWNTVERPGQDSYSPLMDLRADDRMAHAGLPVGDGEKWIANRWIHPIDFDSGVVGLHNGPASWYHEQQQQYRQQQPQAQRGMVQ